MKLLKVMLLASVLCVSPAFSQVEDLAERIRQYVEAHEENGDFMGEVVYVDERDAVTRVIVGMADIESQKAHATGDIYHIASMTKQFTGAAVAILVEANSLKLDDPISKYLPEFPNADELTIRSLVHQYAGVPDYNDFPDYKLKIHENLTLPEIVKWIEESVGPFPPNPGYSYSNSHFALLARIIEIASGMPYFAYLESAVLEPVRMNSTGNYSMAEIIPRRVEGYDPGPNGGLINAIEVNNSIKLGSGSLYSTSDDLVRWHRALQTGEVLSDEVKAIYLKPADSGYAMGISVWQDDFSGERFAAHDGKSPGGFAYMKRWLDSGRALIVLSNVNSGQLNRFKRDLTKIVNGEDVAPPERRAIRSLGEGEAEELVGSYLFPPDNDVRIDQQNGGLVLFWRDTGLPQYLEPLEGSDWFYMRSRAEQVRFLRDDNGQVTGLEYDWGNGIQFCKRLAL